MATRATCPIDFPLISFSTINPLRAKFFWGNINIYLHFMSFLHIDLTQVLKIPPQVRPGPIYSTQSISWLLMSWRRKEPGHQQPWYWPIQTELTRSPHVITRFFKYVYMLFNSGWITVSNVWHFKIMWYLLILWENHCLCPCYLDEGGHFCLSFVV